MAVPGTLMGLVHAYNKFGNISWSSLVQPAIEIAENGFSIQRTLAEAIEVVKYYILDKENFPGMKYVVYVCMYMCVYVYIYIYIYIYIYACVCVCVYVCACLSVRCVYRVLCVSVPVHYLHALLAIRHLFGNVPPKK